MSKVTDLREKYPKVTEVTFKKLVNGDNTPTKKYLEYMLKMWTLKIAGKHNIPSSEALIKEVNLFNDLLPYNPNKDIYSPLYNHFNDLKTSNVKYWDVREEKTFVKAEHISVIYEDDDVILLEPKTHQGSLRYGANTKWCTASKNNPNTFTSYANRGCLAYLIDKSNSKANNYSKLAFINQSGFPLSGQIEIYNQMDSHISEKTVMNNGWDESKIYELLLRYRTYHVDWFRLKQSRDEVSKTVNVLKNINLDLFNKHLNVLHGYDSESKFSQEAKSVLDNFLGELNKNLEKLKI
jgi:hypothetical protein